MRIQNGKILAISLFLIIVPDVSVQAEMSLVTVGFVNKAGVDRKALRQGLEFAAMILQRTEVELLIVDCSLEAAQSAPPCSGFTGPGQISIRVIRRPQKGTDEIGCRRLGFADELDTTPGNGIVYLFGDVIETVAKDRRVPQQDVLGVVITHEIGHLLIAPGHADKGGPNSRRGNGARLPRECLGSLPDRPRSSERASLADGPARLAQPDVPTRCVKHSSNDSLRRLPATNRGSSEVAFT